jgi:hypothetical protein
MPNFLIERQPNTPRRPIALPQRKLDTHTTKRHGFAGLEHPSEPTITPSAAAIRGHLSRSKLVVALV